MSSLVTGAEVLSGQAYWLPVLFIGLMGLAFLLYAILDGYDLGVGILLPFEASELSAGAADAQSEKQRDRMIASIGPFWDANETWLVMAVGLLLVVGDGGGAAVGCLPQCSLAGIGAVVFTGFGVTGGPNAARRRF